ncbi:WGS project CAEQ00000000 data, annotated contig 1 422 [Trichuris trichiura]|uniref:WGS project CAEQ00000000 data, annotated contig 1 422 n=1 Tax=Trichuris trichiura TaxID=36087 RepID=A0A077Z616_TRITR|nr:WGS project CAEQ00000000 data, annotated contig 1 422 [Trichuris trichiura]
MEEAVWSKNASAVAALYTEGCHFMPTGSTRIVLGDYTFQYGWYNSQWYIHVGCFNVVSVAKG